MAAELLPSSTRASDTGPIWSIPAPDTVKNRAMDFAAESKSKSVVSPSWAITSVKFTTSPAETPSAPAFSAIPASSAAVVGITVDRSRSDCRIRAIWFGVPSTVFSTPANADSNSMAGPSTAFRPVARSPIPTVRPPSAFTDVGSDANAVRTLLSDPTADRSKFVIAARPAASPGATPRDDASTTTAIRWSSMAATLVETEVGWGGASYVAPMTTTTEPITAPAMQGIIGRHASDHDDPAATFDRLWKLMQTWARKSIEALGLPYGAQGADIRSFARTGDGLRIEVYELDDQGRRYARNDKVATRWHDGPVALPAEIVALLDD